jgi:beta-glucosidase
MIKSYVCEKNDMKGISLAGLVLLVVACSPKLQPNSQEPADPVEAKVEALLRQMTLEEKIGQMNQYSSFWEVTGPAPAGGDQQKQYEQLKRGEIGSLLNVHGAVATREVQRLVMEHSRLKIPLLIGYDVIHGFKTMFPVPLGEAASWDIDLMERTAQAAAREAAASGIHWTFAPMVDISRDPRWSRVMEGAGEDPYLGSLIAAARVRGFQGKQLSDRSTIAACAKHFAGYGFAEAGRDYNTVDVSEHTMQNIILPPFKSALDAGVVTFMNAFNEVGGVVSTGSRYLQRDLLKGDWGFQGFVVSDWGSIGEMVNHGVAEDKREAAMLAASAGSDMDMESRAYIAYLKEHVQSGAVDEADIDDAVRRILRVKFQLGLFDNPYLYCDEQYERETVMSESMMALSREAARKSMVLLKNEAQLLPLSKNPGTMAVIGPLAADKDAPLGSWRAQAAEQSAVSVLEGVRAAVSAGTEVIYAQGVALSVGERNFLKEITINKTDKSGFAEAISAARKASVVVLVVGEDCWQTGEARSQTDIGLAGLQQALFDELYKVNRNIVVVLMNGRPLAIEALDRQAPAILETWHAGTQSGHAIADVLFGDYNPSGKLPMTFPRHVGQIPLYYNHKATGRGTNPGDNVVFWSHYTDAPNTPLYPFGYGLSYTTFAYSAVKLSSTEMGRGGKIMASVQVKNTGKVAGKETVQLYVQDVVGTVTRPVRELKGYRQVMLAPGEETSVEFELTEEQLAYYTAAGVWAAEKGEFRVYIGGSSETENEARFRLK